VEYLRSCSGVSTIGLWGRSMGAVTALLHGYRDPSIACMILDSPFASLQQLARELVDHSQISIPKFAVGLALRMVRSSVKSRANFDINKLEPVKHADKCFIPALFGCAEGDVFIKPHHSKQIYDAYAGDKNLVTFSGDHNTPREEFFFHSASIFLKFTMIRPSEMELETSISPSNSNRTSDHPPELQQSMPHFDMPAPLSETGGGLGIQVGIPQPRKQNGDEIPQFLAQGTANMNDDYYEEAMIRHAIELSLAEQAQDENDAAIIISDTSSDAVIPPAPPETTPSVSAAQDS